MKAVLLVGHGSKMKGFQDAMEKIAQRLAVDLNPVAVRLAFLEIAAPSIPDAIDSLAARGFTEVKILPYFVQAGKHVQVDLPEIAAWAAEKYRGRVRVTLCPYLGFHDKIVEVVKERIAEGE